MMDQRVDTAYSLWKSKPLEDTDLIKELIAIEGDEAAIYERFYKDLRCV